MPVERQHTVDEFLKVDGFTTQIGPRRVGMGQLVQVLDQADQPHDFILQDVVGFLRRRDDAIGQRLQVPPDIGQRRTQFMGEIGNHRPA